jgi:dTDP-4-amino-4,6-dideoxygalactose transaminase
MLKTIDKQNAERRQRAKKFIEALKDFPELSFQKVKEDKSHVWHLLSAKYSGKKYGKNKDDLISLLNEKYLIKAIVQYYPLYRYPIFKKAGFGEANCPNTDDFFDNMISFPFHLWMSKKDLNYMMNSTKKALEELRK